MTAHLMTRGTARRLDYRFVGEGPPQRWWSAVLDLVVLERPGVVVRGGPDTSGVLVSGIPSARRDVIGTPIRFTIVVDDPSPATLARLVTAGLDEPARAALGAELDSEFSSEEVDAALAGDADAAADLEERLERILEADTDEPDPGDRAVGPTWVGAVQDGDAVAEFRKVSAQLGRGMDGWAFTTAALSSTDGVRTALKSLGAPAAVLLDEGGPDKLVELRVDQGKAPAGPPAGRHAPRHLRSSTHVSQTRPVRGRRLLIGALTVVVVAVVAMTILVIRSSPGPPLVSPTGSAVPTASSTPAPKTSTAPTTASTSARPTGGAGRGSSG